MEFFMKSSLVLIILLLTVSCNKEGSITSANNKSTISEKSLTLAKASDEEIKSINEKLNSNPQYQLTKEEYEIIVTEGLLSESEKEVLGKLFQ